MTREAIHATGHTFQDLASRRVSYVLTTWNKAHLLEQALEKIRPLITPQDELIVVDGESTDGTMEIIARHGELIDTFISEPDVSISHAENKGMLVARGKYIKHLTDDDEYFQDAMAQAIETLEQHPEVGIMVCGGMRQAGEDIWPVYVPPGANYGKSPEDVFKYGVCGCGIIIRRSILAQVGLINYAGVAADGEYIAQAIHNGVQVRFCRINLFHHPIYEHSVINKMHQAWERDMDRIARQYCSRTFYVKFRIKNAILRNPVLRGPALAGHNTVRRITAVLGKDRDKQSDESPVWDGGFS